MLVLTGTIRGEKIKNYTDSNGNERLDRRVIIEQKGTMRNVAIRCGDSEEKIGEKGEEVSIKVWAKAVDYVKVPNQKKKDRKDAVLEFYLARDQESF